MAYSDGISSLSLIPLFVQIVKAFILFYFPFCFLQFLLQGSALWAQPVIFEKDKVTCLGVGNAQRRDDTYPFIGSNEGSKMLYSKDG